MNVLQHGALAHTEQQAIKGPKITSVKPFKREKPRVAVCLVKFCKNELKTLHIYYFFPRL